MASAADRSAGCNIMLQGIIVLLLLGLSSCDPEISIAEGSSLTLPCLPAFAMGLFPKYTWAFTPEQDGETATPKDLEISDHQLSLSSVMKADAGRYTCEVEMISERGPMKMSREFSVKVKEIPVLYERYVVTETEGATVLLPCQSYMGDTTADGARWTAWKEGVGNKINNQNPSKDEEANRMKWRDDDERGWSVEIASVLLEDAGIYYCEFSTKDKKNIFAVELTVEPAPPPRCTNQTHPWEECPDPDSRSWKAIVSESMTGFSASLYSKLSTQHPDSNLLFSPISIAGLLSHLLLGARGETRAELEKYLALPHDFSCIHSAMKDLRNDTKQSMVIASQMFYNPKHDLAESFVNQSLEFYNAMPEKLTDDSERNLKMVSDWVAKKTNNKITELVDSVDSDTQFILLNAVYFIGKWKGTFTSKGKQEMFTTLSGELVPVPVLYSSKFNLVMGYSNHLRAQVAKFSLTGMSSLYIIVPIKLSEKDFREFEDRINEKNIDAMVKEMEKIMPVSAEVTLPKMKMVMNTDLARLLMSMGLSDLFDSPNLCGMFPEEEPVVLTDVRHRAFLSLTEKGVEAAAASSISYSRSFNSFSALQPFVMMVWSEQAECPLFMGRVLRPQKKD